MQSIESGIADALLSLIPRALRGNPDAVIIQATVSALHRALVEIDPPHIVAALLTRVVDTGDLPHLMETTCASILKQITDNRAKIVKNIKPKLPKLVPGFIEDWIAEALVEAAEQHLQAIQTAGSRQNTLLQKWLRTLPTQIQTPDGPVVKLLVGLKECIAERDLKDVANTLWQYAKEMINSDLEASCAQARTAVLSFLNSVSEDDLDSVALRRQINESVEALCIKNIPIWRHEIKEFITDTIRKQDSTMFVKKIESRVGRDLQFIRLNGTVIGAIIGLVLYWINLQFNRP